MLKSVLLKSVLFPTSLSPTSPLPFAFKSGKVTGLRARGGLAVDIESKNGKLVSATILSLVGTDCSVLYKGKTRQLYLKQGQTIQLVEKNF